MAAFLHWCVSRENFTHKQILDWSIAFVYYQRRTARLKVPKIACAYNASQFFNSLIFKTSDCTIFNTTSVEHFSFMKVLRFFCALVASYDKNGKNAICSCFFPYSNYFSSKTTTRYNSTDKVSFHSFFFIFRKLIKKLLGFRTLLWRLDKLIMGGVHVSMVEMISEENLRKQDSR